ncbi:MAG TPA: FAD binding domain-containing protein [Stellaceae bacterium]|jgi:carbon-monoxide dehydrogenase medium subunit
MKVPAFDYVRPQSLVEAVRFLAGAGGEARVIAGGQSLLALMNLRLAAPEILIDIARLPELAAAGEDDDAVSLGAGVTHAAIEDRRVPDPSRGLMPRAAASLAYRAIRTRGTLGGSLALADPAAEWPAVLAALDAQAIVCGAGGRRMLDCGSFATGIYETRLADDEIVESVRIAKLSPGARWGYVKLSRKSGEFANTLAVAVADRARGHCRVVLGAANGPPLVLADASRCLADGARDPDALRGAIGADLDRAADRHFDDFQRNLHIVAAMRAIRQATA